MYSYLLIVMPSGQSLSICKRKSKYKTSTRDNWNYIVTLNVWPTRRNKISERRTTREVTKLRQTVSQSRRWLLYRRGTENSLSNSILTCSVMTIPNPRDSFLLMAKFRESFESLSIE